MADPIHFEFRTKPFPATVDPDFFFPSESAQAACDRLLAALRKGGGLCLLTGEPGTGKTMVMHRIMRTMPRAVIPIVTRAPLDADDFASLIAGTADVVAPSTSLGGPADAVRSALAASAAAGGSVVMAIDEAQALSDEALKRLTRLVNGRGLTRVLVVGQPELRTRLAALSRHDATLDVALSCQLEPIALHEVPAYIAHRLRKAGEPSIDVFSPDAIQRIAALSRGVPRLVNQICAEAMMAVRDTGMSVCVPAVEQVAERLGLAGPVPEPDRGVPARRARPGGARRRRRISPSSSWPKRLAGPAVAAVLAASVALVLVNESRVPHDVPLPAAGSDQERAAAPPAGITSKARTGPEVGNAEVTRPARPDRPQAFAGVASPAPPPRPTLPPRPALPPHYLPPRQSSEPQSPASGRTSDPVTEQMLLKRAQDGDAAGIRSLLAEGVRPDGRDASGLTPLMLAIIHDHLAAIDVLLGGGASINARNDAGQTPLILAAIANKPAIVHTVLARGGDINARTKVGWTALMYAAWKGHSDVARLLLDRGADPTLTDRAGWTALRYATWRVTEPESGDGAVKIEADSATAEDLLASAAAGPGHTEVVGILREAGLGSRQDRGGPAAGRAAGNR